MRFSHALRAGLVALTAMLGASFASTAYADSGSISFRILKAGFVVGGSGGSGTLTFHGKSYPISIGGLSYGFTFGASETRFHGTVSNITGRRMSPVFMPRRALAGRSAQARRRSCSPTRRVRCSRSSAARPASSSAWT